MVIIMQVSRKQGISSITCFMRNSSEAHQKQTLYHWTLLNYFKNSTHLLVTFIKLATCSIRECHHAHLEPESVAAKCTNIIPQYFILSLLMNCINPNQCNMLHTILSDIVEVCGGSRLLIKVLNRLGCVSSADTRLVYNRESRGEAKEPDLGWIITWCL